MADFNSIQMTAPRHPVSGPGMGGRSLHVVRGEADIPAGTAVGKTIAFTRLHPRFRVLGGFIKTTGLGAGTVNVGDAASANRYFAAANMAAAATSVALAETGRDYLNPKYEDVIGTIAGAATTAAGKVTVVLYGIIEEPA